MEDWQDQDLMMTMNRVMGTPEDVLVAFVPNLRRLF